MHELSIATEIVRIVKEQAAKEGVERITAVKLRIGALTCVDPEALRFAFEAVTAGTRLAAAKIEVDRVPVRGICNACGSATEVHELLFTCPNCGSGDLEIVQGEELDVAYIVAS